MTLEDVLKNLCYYDSRNPYGMFSDLFDDDIDEIPRLMKDGECSCDNCFYGRTKLAEYILEKRMI